MSNFKSKIYKSVQQIPKGKVVTYGQLSKRLKINPRWVGHILHLNTDSNVPCHRVVDRNGKIAQNYAFGGWRKQKRRLELEGVKFKDKMHVDLSACLWQA